MDWWMIRLMDWWIDRCIDGWMVRWIDESTDQCIDRWINRLIDLWIDRLNDGWMNWWINGLIHRWMDWSNKTGFSRTTKMRILRQKYEIWLLHIDRKLRSRRIVVNYLCELETGPTYFNSKKSWVRIFEKAVSLTLAPMRPRKILWVEWNIWSS